MCNKIMQQVRLHKQDMKLSIALVLNPYNNNLDNLEDIDNAESSLLIYS